jgi:hypothetical protein
MICSAPLRVMTATLGVIMACPSLMFIWREEPREGSGKTKNDGGGDTHNTKDGTHNTIGVEPGVSFLQIPTKARMSAACSLYPVTVVKARER